MNQQNWPRKHKPTPWQILNKPPKIFTANSCPINLRVQNLLMNIFKILKVIPSYNITRQQNSPSYKHLMGLKSPLKTQGWKDSWYLGWNFGLKNSGLKCHVTSWCNASIQNSGEPFLSRWRMSLCRSVKCKSPSGAKWKRSNKPETLCLLFLQNLCPSEWIWNKTVFWDLKSSTAGKTNVKKHLYVLGFKISKLTRDLLS